MKVIGKFILAMAMIASSLVLFAQDSSDREFYLRPSYWRPYDKRGINVFETNKLPDSIPYEGPRIRFGAGFTQQFQALTHENTDAINNGGSSISTAGANKLYPISPGFMTSMANLYIDAQLADGIRLNLTSYLSTRHHNETWVKGGYIQLDKFPFKGNFWDMLTHLTTIKIGHMEINYGDQHFRRSDGGHTLYNPFMDNYIIDEFTTEIAGEVYIHLNGLFGMIGISSGTIKGGVDSVIATTADQTTSRNPSIYLKGGIDKTIGSDLRLRLTGSYYHNSSSPTGLTLYGGDRTGSNYQNVMEKWVTNPGTNSAAPQASTTIAFSGRFNPGFSKLMDAYMINGFAKWRSLEFFGTWESAKGRSKNETDKRTANQFAAEGLFRFGHNESLYVGARYNGVESEMPNLGEPVHINRFAGAAGWFVTRNLLLKAEYLVQEYLDFPTSDYRAGGKFDGFVVEAVVGF
jgi:hypothetical protein